VTITEEKAQPHAATIVEGPTHPARSQRRRSWRKVATWAVACSAVVLAAGGYLAVHKSSEPATVRARTTDSARLQGQADAYAAQ
jgi:type VI protein secretion system component VasF